MKRKTLITEARRNVRRNRASFLTLCMIILLGLGGFFAAQYTVKSMKTAGRSFFEANRFMDFDLYSSAGIGEEELEELRSVPGVTAAEGRFSSDAVYSFASTEQAVQVLSLTEQVSTPVLLEGRLPTAPWECLADPDLLEDSGAAIGDVIRIRSAGRNPVNTKADPDTLKVAVGELQSGSYTVTGAAYHPDWLRRDSTYTVVVLPEAFGGGEDRAPRFHSASILTDEGEGEDPFTDGYFKAVRSVRDRLEQVTETLQERWRIRFQERFPGRDMPEEMQENWIVLDRRSNAGYTEYRSTIGAVRGAGLSFGMLFLLVTGMECFSTVSLLVEEQKKLVGTVKAFGFRRFEIRFRYTRFSVLAAVIGGALGFVLACGLGKLLLFLLERTELYVFSADRLVLRPGLTLAVCAAVTVFCALVAGLACRQLLRSSADELMKGASSADTGFRWTEGHSRSKSLYTHLILRNMLREKGRVIMTVIVTAVSCILIGTGITVKLAYDGMNIRQLRDVCLYDLRIEPDAGTEVAVRRQLEAEMDALGVSWIPACYETRLFENGDRLDATLMLCAEAEQLGEIIGLTDPVSGLPLSPEDGGVLIQLRMAENLAISPGDSLTVLDARFKRVTAQVSGAFQNYQKRMVLLTPEEYAALFGTRSEANSYFVKLNGTDDQTLRDALMRVSPEIGFERADSFFEQYRSIAFMYNVVVLSVTVIAILITFVIFMNLSAIFISRKKRELIIMRINGFSLRRTRSYLIREIAATTVIGIALGVLAGIPTAGVVVRFMETPDIMFVREIQPLAWLIAAALESSFAVIIYGSALRKVRDWSVEDLADVL